MVYHSDEIPRDIGFSFTGLLPMHCVYWNFDTIKIFFSWFKATFPIFKNGAYFSVTSNALNDINVRGGKAINTFSREIGTSLNCIVLADKGDMSQKTMDMWFMHVKCLFKKIQHAFLHLLKSVFTIWGKIYAVYISVLFKKSVTYQVRSD